MFTIKGVGSSRWIWLKVVSFDWSLLKGEPQRFLANVARQPFFERSLGTLQRQNAENFKQIFPEKEYRGLSPNFHIYVFLSELYIPPRHGSAFFAVAV
jgi:hypothetical protein